MTARVSVDRNELDRQAVLRMDGVRYGAQLTPDLTGRVDDLTQALEFLLAAAADASPDNLLEAMARARRVLET